MAFAGGMCVFPGGGVDPRDFDHAVGLGRARRRRSGPRGSAPTRPPRGRWSAPRCARRSRSPGCCWPASPRDTVVADTTGDDWETDRAALEARELSFTDFLDRRGLVLRTDLLGVWAGWLTPVFEPRRYRTWFFVADLPEGQRTRDVSTESDQVDLAAGDAGGRATSSEEQMFMLPPTYLHLPRGRPVRRPGRACSPRPASRDRRDVHAARSRRTTTAGRSPSPPRLGARLHSELARSIDGLGRWRRSASGRACVLAPNANMMTLDGTNTWVLREPGARRSVVIDPGPPDESHLDAVAEQAGDVGVVLLTHHHLDHSEAAKEFAERMGCGVRALDPEYRLGSEGLGDGDVVEVDGLEVHVVATPGPHRRLAVVRAAGRGGRADRRHRAGPRHDGGGAPGRPARRLPRLARPAARPGRGAARSAPSGPGTARSSTTRCGALDYYIAHRAERLGAGRVGAGATCATQPHPEGMAADELPRRVVEIVYADVDPVLWGAAELSVRAQLAYLAHRD